jgi:hypothetical protein
MSFPVTVSAFRRHFAAQEAAEEADQVWPIHFEMHDFPGESFAPWKRLATVAAEMLLFHC